VLSGDGGVGTSRLARELCAELTNAEWVAGPLAQDPARPVSRLARVDAAVLVVVDYAETRTDDVVALLRALAASPPSRGRRRVVLVARQLGDWWSELGRAKDDRVRELVRCALPINVGAAEETAADRHDAYREALTAFAAHTGAPPGGRGVAPPLADGLFETLLFIHMAALSRSPGRRRRHPARRVGVDPRRAARTDTRARTALLV
jgi:hypothetical protein